MRIEVQKPLFAWDCLEDHPTLATIKRLLDAIPDSKLLEGLRAARGKGRDDYPVRALWGVALLTVALRHTSFEACLGELRRNPTLARLVGFESEEQVPSGWNLSRFLDVLGQSPHREELQAMFNQMVERLAGAVSDLGRHTAGDATALRARKRRGDRAKEPAACDGATQSAGASPGPAAGGEAPPAPQPAVSDDAGASAASATPGGAAKPIEYDEHGLPQPSGGRKEYTDGEGRVTHVVEWFGYKLHLLVDAKHEVVLAYRISSSKTGDNEVLPELVDQAQENLPAGRIQTLAYDKAADDGKVHEKLHQCQIKPVIQNRSLWKGDQEQLLPGHDGQTNIVYDEAGTLYCYDRVSAPMVRRPMAFIGHEASRGTLKYRCPAMHDGLPCAMSEICNAGKKYGLTVRVKQEIDLRRFPPIPRATKQFERRYKGRTSVERVNARIKIFWGADDGNVTGAPRFFAMTGIVMVVHAAFATVLAGLPRHEGTLGRLRLGPIAKALAEAIALSDGKTPPAACGKRKTKKRRPPRQRKSRPRRTGPSLFR